MMSKKYSAEKTKTGQSWTGALARRMGTPTGLLDEMRDRIPGRNPAGRYHRGA